MSEEGKRCNELKLRLTDRELADLERLAALDGRTVTEMAVVLTRRWMYGMPELRALAPVANDESPKPRKVPRRRKQVFDASNGKCVYCGTLLKLDGKWHIDHRMPRALLGSDEPSNLAASCVPCNLKKRDRTDVEFMSVRAA